MDIKFPLKRVSCKKDRDSPLCDRKEPLPNERDLKRR